MSLSRPEDIPEDDFSRFPDDLINYLDPVNNRNLFEDEVNSIIEDTLDDIVPARMLNHDSNEGKAHKLEVIITIRGIFCPS